MKKLFVMSALAFLVITGFTSCKKCEVCTRSASPEIRLCEKDYSNNTAFGVAVDGYESQGYNCK